MSDAETAAGRVAISELSGAKMDYVAKAGNLAVRSQSAWGCEVLHRKSHRGWGVLPPCGCRAVWQTSVLSHNFDQECEEIINLLAITLHR